MNRPVPPARDDFPHFVGLETRWMDNDVYGHVNNVAYYSFFDTAVNRYLIESGALDPVSGDTIGLVVETRCTFFRPLSFPDRIDVGIRVDHVGDTSVRYALGVFRRADPVAAASGRFVHVYVDARTRRPRPPPPGLRTAIERIASPGSDGDGHG